MKCLVVSGSFTAEDKYGRISAGRVSDALTRAGWAVSVLHASERGKILQTLSDGQYDLVVPVGFGPPCEDGHIFAVARMAGIPAAGPTPAVGSLTLDKAMLSRVVDSVFGPGAGVRSPRGIAVSGHMPFSDFAQKLSGISGPFVVKPNFSGSSDGLSVCASLQSAHAAVLAMLPSETSVLVQQLEGPVTCEVSCTTLTTDAGTVFLPIVELAKGGALVMDAQLKFGDSATSQHIIPPRLPRSVLNSIETTVMLLIDVIGAVGLSRTDLLVMENGDLVVLEINGIPGLLPTSIAVDAAAAGGISFDDLSLKYAMSAFLPRKEPNVWI